MTSINQTKAEKYYMKNMAGGLVRMTRLIEKATGKVLFSTFGVCTRKELFGSMEYSSRFAK